MLVVLVCSQGGRFVSRNLLNLKMNAVRGANKWPLPMNDMCPSKDMQTSMKLIWATSWLTGKVFEARRCQSYAQTAWIFVAKDLKKWELGMLQSAQFVARRMFFVAFFGKHVGKSFDRINIWKVHFWIAKEMLEIYCYNMMSRIVFGSTCWDAHIAIS